MDDAAARKELDRLLAGQSARTVRLAAQVARAVAAAVANGEDPEQAVRSGMEAVGMAQAVRDTVATAVVQSVCVGYGIWPSVSAAPSEAFAGLKATALSSVWDDSGMTLSTRLHGTDQAMRAEIVKAIKDGVDAKASTWDTQRKIYDGYGFGGAIKQAKLSELPKDLQDLADQARKVLTPEDFAQLQLDAKRLRAYADRLATGPLRAAYGQMADRLEKGLTKGLDRLVQTATEEKARYHASRIQRTEAARAWGQGFHAQCMDDPDVVGIKWNLSTSHKLFDICDFNHTADLYGMGPGVYPKAKWPRYPAHPHCHCPQIKVFVGMVPAERDNVEAGGKAALGGMTESQRARLLTIKGAQGFKGGASWKGDLRHYDGAVSSGMSPGARAVVMGVKQWQPDLQLVPGVGAAKAIAASPASPSSQGSSRPKKTQATPAVPKKAVGPVVDVALAVEAEERAIWKRKVENAAIVKKGEEVERVKGRKRSVGFTKAQVDKMEGAVLTHNHPSGWDYPEGEDLHAGNSFSLADLTLASGGKVEEIRAITPVWEYSIKPDGKFASKLDITMAHSKARDEVNKAYMAELKAGGNPLSSDFHHRVIEKVANDIGWIYSRRKHGY